VTPQEFIAKWQPVELTERSACQQHFLDLCELLGQPKPAAADPQGAWYCFERGVSKSEGGSDDGARGWADVWMRGHFGWEYKGKKKRLDDAYKQLLQYRESLENPPLLVVCDLDRFEIHTNFTGTAKRVFQFDLAGLAEPKNLDVLRRLFTDPDSLRPGVTSQSVTEQVAEQFGRLSDGLRLRGIPAHDAAHFLMKLMFCMFAEDINLLHGKLFSRSLAGCKKDSARLTKVLQSLFQAMATGGLFGADEIPYFNGGLFADASTIDLVPDEIQLLLEAAAPDWSVVEPHIFGTLFERTLDPAKRSQIGAHYTSSDDIKTLLEPVMMTPLRREWQAVQDDCAKLLPKLAAEAKKTTTKVTKGAKESKPRRDFNKRLLDFVARLAHVTVLDPACGSGNFLYVALRLLLDLEKEVITFAASHGLGLLPQVRPTQLHGIEINPFAAELAQVVIWIGYLQWMRDNGFNPPSNPVLEPIKSIENRDAILDLTDPEHPKEPEWPEAEFIVGNPPFLGDKMMRGGLGHEYVDTLRKFYDERIPGQSDLCCYWFEKARSAIKHERVTRAGLLATQGIRGGSNRTVLDRITADCRIFWAMSDREWILDGAMVHVSMVGFDNGSEKVLELDGQRVDSIASNLTTGSAGRVTTAQAIQANEAKCFLGVMKAGNFDISDELAKALLKAPNPHGRPNSDVLRPRVTARDVLQRGEVGWIVDFGCDTPEEDCALYEVPWKHIETHVKPERKSNRRKRMAEKWWLHGEARPGLRKSLEGCTRFIVTPEVSKHRVFAFLDDVFLADHQTRAFPFDDDYHFGVLHSRIHETWARAQGTQLRERESGFRYTPSTCFETFPFPNPTDAQREAIAAAAKELDQLRTNWLNPPEWTRVETLEFPGSADGPWARYVHDADSRGIGTVRYPRVVPKDEECARQLKKRTLTNLYNDRPAWLDLAHQKLDAAVFAAYGWPVTLTDDELLARLLELNLARSQG
jgi:type II restriction/modification system DNA methylase subunit YeeA